MDEYIKREDAISAMCFGCNQQFSNEPCEPNDCALRQALNHAPTADVAPKSEVDYWKRQAYNGCMDKQRMDDKINELGKEIERLHRRNGENTDYLTKLIRAEKQKGRASVKIAEAEAIKEFANRLRSHYPHTNSILKRIDCIEKEMLEEAKRDG